MGKSRSRRQSAPPPGFEGVSVRHSSPNANPYSALVADGDGSTPVDTTGTSEILRAISELRAHMAEIGEGTARLGEELQVRSSDTEHQLLDLKSRIDRPRPVARISDDRRGARQTLTPSQVESAKRSVDARRRDTITRGPTISQEEKIAFPLLTEHVTMAE